MKDMLEEIVEEINYKFESKVIAQERGNYIYLTSRGKRINDCWELEEYMEDVFKYVTQEFDVDFDIITYNKNTLVVEVYTY